MAVAIVAPACRKSNRKDSHRHRHPATVTPRMSALPNDPRRRGIQSLVKSSMEQPPSKPIPIRKLMALNPSLVSVDKKTGDESPFQGYLLQKRASRWYNAALAADALANKMQAPAPVEMYEVHPETWEQIKRDSPALAATFEVFDIVKATKELGIDLGDNPDHSLN